MIVKNRSKQVLRPEMRNTGTTTMSNSIVKIFNGSKNSIFILYNLFATPTNIFVSSRTAA